MRHAAPVRRSARSSQQYQLVVDLLVDARNKAGMTQTELAKALGRPQSWVSKIEAGERRIDPAELVTLARAVQADPVVLIRSLEKLMASQPEQR